MRATSSRENHPRAIYDLIEQLWVFMNAGGERRAFILVDHRARDEFRRRERALVNPTRMPNASRAQRIHDSGSHAKQARETAYGQSGGRLFAETKGGKGEVRSESAKDRRDRQY